MRFHSVVPNQLICHDCGVSALRYVFRSRGVEERSFTSIVPRRHVSDCRRCAMHFPAFYPQSMLTPSQSGKYQPSRYRISLKSMTCIKNCQASAGLALHGRQLTPLYEVRLHLSPKSRRMSTAGVVESEPANHVPSSHAFSVQSFDVRINIRAMT